MIESFSSRLFSITKKSRFTPENPDDQNDEKKNPFENEKHREIE